MTPRRAIVSWCLFDFANSAFTTVIVTSVFGVWFVSVLVPAGGLATGAGGRALGLPEFLSGEFLWSAATALSLLLSAALAPIAGAGADAGGGKRKGLIVSSCLCVGASAALAASGLLGVAYALAAFVIANVAFEVGYVFYNGFLPEIAPADAVGRLSGLGWGIGYLGGLVSLATALLILHLNGGTLESPLGVPLVCLAAAAHFLIFSIPSFAWLRDAKPPSAIPAGRLIALSVARLRTTIGHLAAWRQAVRFLLASLLYNDGATTIFVFAGIYMERVLRLDASEIVLSILLLNLPSAAGSVLLGYAGDRWGGRRTILLTLAIMIVSVLGIALTAPADGAGPEALTRARTAFLLCAGAAAFAIGANQAASRALMARFIPAGRQAEFFGFYIFSGKLASVAAPLTYGLIVQVSGSNVLGILSVTAFLLAGAAVLLTVNEAEGLRAAAGAG